MLGARDRRSVLTICMPSGNDGLGREVDGGDHAPGDMDVAVLIVMEEGRGGGGKTTEYGLAVKYCNVHGLAVVPTIHVDRSIASATAWRHSSQHAPWAFTLV
jgi:hypothetical protein